MCVAIPTEVWLKFRAALIAADTARDYAAKSVLYEQMDVATDAHYKRRQREEWAARRAILERQAEQRRLDKSEARVVADLKRLADLPQVTHDELVDS